MRALGPTRARGRGRVVLPVPGFEVVGVEAERLAVVDGPAVGGGAWPRGDRRPGARPARERTLLTGLDLQPPPLAGVPVQHLSLHRNASCHGWGRRDPCHRGIRSWTVQKPGIGRSWPPAA